MTARFVSRLTALAAVAAVAGFTGSAQAADMPTGPVDFAPPPVAAFDWTGPYLGIHFGYVTGDYDTSLAGVESDGDGFVIGGTAGYNVQIDQFVIGIEGDLGYLGAEGDDFGVAGVSAEADFYGTLRGRGGIAFDRFLVYATGGIAFLNVDVNSGILGLGTDDNTHFGYTVGGGAEVALTDAISAKLEYLYVDYDDKNYFGVFDADFDGHVIRGGINYRF